EAVQPAGIQAADRRHRQGAAVPQRGERARAAGQEPGHRRLVDPDRAAQVLAHRHDRQAVRGRVPVDHRPAVAAADVVQLRGVRDRRTRTQAGRRPARSSGRGRVRLAGHDVTTASPGHRARLGLGRTYQVPRPFGSMTVFENALVGAVRGGGLRRQAAHTATYAALARTGLAAKANVRAHRLTLLERKRLELARALATQPSVLLLDEIAGGLTEPETDALL